MNSIDLLKQLHGEPSRVDNQECGDFYEFPDGKFFYIDWEDDGEIEEITLEKRDSMIMQEREELKRYQEKLLMDKPGGEGLARYWENENKIRRES